MTGRVFTNRRLYDPFTIINLKFTNFLPQSGGLRRLKYMTLLSRLNVWPTFARQCGFEVGENIMKRYLSLIFLCAGLILSGVALASNINAQVKSKRGTPQVKSSDNSKKAPLPSKAASLLDITRARKGGALAPSDPCATSIAIPLAQVVTDSLASGDCRLSDGT